MSNQALGAGDAPTLIDTNRNADSPSSPWTNLPKSVYKLFGSMLDTEGLRTMRLVCSEWRKNVEQCVGLKVKVDDSIEGNLEFVRRIKVGKARVLNWSVDIGTSPANQLLQHPDWIKKLKLCGKMPAKWKIHDLGQFPNLAHLVLRDKALHSNNLTGHQFPVPNFDLTSDLSLEELLTKAFQTQDPPSEDQPIELKNLQTLEIIRHGNSYDYFGYDNDYIHRHVQLQTHGYLVLVANVCFILSHVTSPLLTVAHLTVSLPDRLHGFLNKLNWTLVHLHTFLNNHRTSLRQLLLPSLRGQSSDLFQHENLSNSFPINLQKLMLNLCGPTRDHRSGEGSPQNNFVYLENCLQRQTQLQEVLFHFNAFPIKWTSDAFTSLANSCGRTLRYLELQWMPGHHDGSLDLQILSVCQRLEVLHIPWLGHRSITVKNVDKLPASLKRLVIWSCDANGHIEIGDPNIFKRLTALEWLCLNAIHLPTASNKGYQEHERQFCRTMIKDLLGLRQLQGFKLEVHSLALNTDPSLVKMLRPLDQRINPALRHPQSSTSCNMNWRYYDRRSIPWSEVPFDLHTWNLEKFRDEEERRPRRPAVLDQPVAGRIQDEAGENANEVDDDDEDEDMDFDLDDDDEDEDMDFDLDEEDVSSDEDDL